MHCKLQCIQMTQLLNTGLLAGCTLATVKQVKEDQFTFLVFTLSYFYTLGLTPFVASHCTGHVLDCAQPSCVLQRL